jgi:hypothetical protein
MVNKKQATFDEVRERVKQDLMHKEHQKVMKNWEDDLLKSAGFVIYDQILEEVLAEGISKEQQKQKGAEKYSRLKREHSC